MAWPVFLLAAAIAPAMASYDLPRPEHPDPQRFRPTWMNLNGPWSFAESDEADLPAEFPDTITVPFARESELSGLGRKGFVENVWYRRTVEVPQEWAGKRVWLRIGACDWRTTVWCDGKPLGTHTGGNGLFSFELPAGSGPRELLIHAFDDTRSGLQQTGKQAHTEKSESIFYTRTTGIWQSVWLEAVPRTFIADYALEASISGKVQVRVYLDGPIPAGATITAEASWEGRPVAKATAPAKWYGQTELALTVPDPKLWDVGAPNLYELKLTYSAGEPSDEVSGYFGIREISVDGNRLMLNGRPVFQRLVLDQGFYPDGIWTAPSDAALRRDIELSQAVGFNGARLHQKVFEPRFHYWADKLGYLTWGEGPSYGAAYENPAVNLPIMQEWAELMRRDRNHPSIVGWCPFNETVPAAGPLQNGMYEMTKALDPTRPVIETSGWVKSYPNPDVDCRHDYDQNPTTFRERYMASLPARYGGVSLERPFIMSEFGGIGWVPEGETGWGYGNNPKTPEEFKARLEGLCKAMLDNPRVAGFCYTQLTDVEQERNGVFYYDRTPKFADEVWRGAFGAPAAIEAGPAPAVEEPVVLLGSAVDSEAATWSYSFAEPSGPWQTASASWPASRGAFGAKEGFERLIAVPWTTPDLWLRGSFEWDGGSAEGLVLAMHHDNQVTVWLNGVQVFQRGGWTDGYGSFALGPEFANALKPGRNELAVHVHQDKGGQFFDMAILRR